MERYGTLKGEFIGHDLQSRLTEVVPVR